MDKRVHKHKYEHIGVIYTDEFVQSRRRMKEKNKERFGQVVNESADKSIWWVIWDGTKTKDSISKKYVIAVNTTTEEIIEYNG